MLTIPSALRVDNVVDDLPELVDTAEDIRRKLLARHRDEGLGGHPRAKTIELQRVGEHLGFSDEFESDRVDSARPALEDQILVVDGRAADLAGHDHFGDLALRQPKAVQQLAPYVHGSSAWTNDHHNAADG